MSSTQVESEIELASLPKNGGDHVFTSNEAKSDGRSIMAPKMSPKLPDTDPLVATSRETLYAEPEPPSKLRSAGVMTTLACISLLNSFNSGMLTVALPTIAKELALPENLLLWPASVYALAQSCTLLLMGAIADIVGNRPIFITGSLLHTAWTLAVSLSKTGNQLIAFRALQGIAMSFCMPTAVGTLTATFPTGRLRNVAFAVFGGGSPIGFALGLFLGGVFVKLSDWRTGYYMSAGINATSLLLAWFVLPGKNTLITPPRQLKDALAHDFDWVGIASASGCLALLSYVFAEITHGSSAMKQPHVIALLTVAVLLVPFFIFWEGRQERTGRPAILPNSIWRRSEFTTVCVSVFLVWSWFNAFGYWSTLYFQITQELDAFQAALRFLPLVVIGLATNVVAGLVVDKVGASTLMLIGGILSAASPIIFALQDPGWSYWVSGFPAMLLSAISTDLLFNISNLVITTNFPSKSQALAGGVFNTVTQLGNSIGLAVTAMVSASVNHSSEQNRRVASGELTYDYATLSGYRSAFWTCFAAAVISTGISAIGLRKAGKVGMKKTV
jgi:MFS family permease